MPHIQKLYIYLFIRIQIGDGRETHISSMRSDPSLQSHHFPLSPSIRSTHSKFGSQAEHSNDWKHGCQYLPILYC